MTRCRLLAEEIRRKQRSAESLVESALAQARRHHAWNAYIFLDEQGALRQARERDRANRRDGALFGVPIAVKDNVHVAGMPNTAGTPALKSFLPTHDAAVVRRLRDAGAVLMGKTNLHELAFGISSANAAFGEVGNAFDMDCIAGGSSGGSAVAVALGMAHAAVGTDTGGSVRIPAALNGLVGFRPTVGRYPNDGMTLISTTRDTAGPMVRDVADARLVDAVMAGYPVSTATEIDPHQLRLGIPDTRFTDALEPSLARVFGAALTRLERAGVTLVNVETSEIDRLNNELGGVVLYETARLMPDYLKRAGFEGSMVDFTASIASADVRDIFGAIFSGTIDEAYYQHAMNTVRPALQQAYRDTLVGPQLDALIFPTVPMAARPLGEDRMSVLFDDQTVNAFGLYIRNTDPGSNAGIPGISVPAGIDARGMPVGVELDGAAGSDDHLLNVAECVERIFADD